MKRLKELKRRHSGFTLVELLIVIMIISILAGMILLAAGSAIDGAEATKVINDLRDVKACALMYYMDLESWPLGSPDLDATTIADLGKYMDGASAGFLSTRYSGVYTLSDAVTDRSYIGLELQNNVASPGVKKKLIASARIAGLYEDIGTAYSGTVNIVYMPMN